MADSFDVKVTSIPRHEVEKDDEGYQTSKCEPFVGKFPFSRKQNCYHGKIALKLMSKNITNIINQTTFNYNKKA